MTATANPFQKKAGSKGGGDFGPPPDAGSHAAVLVAMIDLGLHEESFQGGPVTTKRKALLVWELVGEKVPGTDKNHFIAREYTVSENEKAGIRKVAEKVRGKAYQDGDDIDYTGMVGRPMLVTVQHKQVGEKTYASVGDVTALPKGMLKPAATVKPFAWFIGCGEPVPQHEWLPWIYGEKVADKVARGSRALKAEEDAGEEEEVPASDVNGHADDDQIPF